MIADVNRRGSQGFDLVMAGSFQMPPRGFCSGRPRPTAATWLIAGARKGGRFSSDAVAAAARSSSRPTIFASAGVKRSVALPWSVVTTRWTVPRKGSAWDANTVTGSPFMRIASAVRRGTLPRVKDPTWADLEQLVTKLADVLSTDWQVPLPAPDSEASPTVSAATDEWCRVLLRDLAAEIEPPADVKPWLLARLRCAIEMLRMLQREHRLPPPGHLGRRLQWLLIDRWHAAGVKMWPHLNRIQGHGPN